MANKLLELLVMAILITGLSADCPPVPYRLRPDGRCPLMSKPCADHLRREGGRVDCTQGTLSLGYSIRGTTISTATSIAHIECIDDVWHTSHGKAIVIDFAACTVPLACEMCPELAFSAGAEVVGHHGKLVRGARPSVTTERYTGCSVISCHFSGGNLAERLPSGEIVELQALGCHPDRKWYDRHNQVFEQGSRELICV